MLLRHNQAILVLLSSFSRALKSQQYDYVRQDIQRVVDAAKGKALVKVIIETALLTDEEKVKACELAKGIDTYREKVVLLSFVNNFLDSGFCRFWFQNSVVNHAV